MNIGVIGAGYVGITTSVAFAKYGHKVFVMDQDPTKISMMKQNRLPFYEDGLENEFQQLQLNGNLLFTGDLEECIRKSDYIFIAVGTPSSPQGEADLSYVEAAARSIGGLLNDYKIIVIKSTVPVGTGDHIKKIIGSAIAEKDKKIPFDLVSNPEFLREGKALEDALHPERIVIGCEPGPCQKAMERLYKDVSSTILFTSVRDAEMIKYASNAFLAAKISFINELARLCEKTGANINEVAKGMGLDSRIGPQFLRAGIGYGGSCFPKDLKALLAMASEKKTPMDILTAVSNVNDTQAEWFLEKVIDALGPLEGKQIALLGLTFKPQTDDIREASSLRIIDFLLHKKAIITAFDPKGTENMKKIYPDILYASSPLAAVKNAEAILVVTEWNEIVEMDWEKAKVLASGSHLFDGRNALDPSAMKRAGFIYKGVGISSF